MKETYQGGKKSLQKRSSTSYREEGRRKRAFLCFQMTRKQTNDLTKKSRPRRADNSQNKIFKWAINI